MLTDFLGREECRTFVLGDQVSVIETFSIFQQSETVKYQGGGGSVDLFGSANIEGWLQLQLLNKVIFLSLPN